MVVLGGQGGERRGELLGEPPLIGRCRKPHVGFERERRHALAASGGGATERGEVVQRPARDGREVSRREGVGDRARIDGNAPQRLRRDGVRRSGPDVGAIDAAAHASVLLRLHQLLRLELAQVVQHPLAGHPDGFRELWRRLRPLEQMEQAATGSAVAPFERGRGRR